MEAAASIVGIVSFGLTLAKSLQTFIDSVIEAEETIILIVAEVHATASTLKRLQDFIEQDKAASEEEHRATVFNDTGLKEIGACALQCEKIYVQIIVLIEKASMQNGEDGSKDTKPQAPAADDSNAAAVRLAIFSKNVTKLGRKMRWPWLEPRIKRCQEHLGRLKVSLMLSLQVFFIAQSRSRPLVALVSNTNDENELRDTAETLRKKWTQLRAKQNPQNPQNPPNRRPPGFGDGTREVSVVSSITSEAPNISEGILSSSEDSDGGSYVRTSSSGSGHAHRRRKSRTSRVVTALRAFKAHVRKRTERKSVFKKDSASAIFEAYLIYPLDWHGFGSGSGGATASASPIKLPFGHRRLTREVKRALRQCNPWDVLFFLSPADRSLVDRVVQQIQLVASPNMSICLVAIDMDGYNDADLLDFNTEFPLWKRMVLFFRVEPIYSEERMGENRAHVTGVSPRFTAGVGNVFRSGLRKNKKRKELQAKIQREKDEKQSQEARIKADRESIERGHAELEEGKKALDAERNQIKELRRDLEAEKARIAEEKRFLESKTQALKTAEEAVLKSIESGTAEQELKRIFEEGRAKTMLEEERSKKKMEDELNYRRLREEHAKAAAEKAAAEKEKAKSPVKFKDAVDRKFTFPFHLVQTWEGMENFVKQAFLHVDMIGPQVQEGRYDLLDSEEQVILPSAWARTIKPGASITMRMWPMEREPLPGTQHSQHMGSGRPMHFGIEQRYPMPGAHVHHGGGRGEWNSPNAWAPPMGPPPVFTRPFPGPPPPPGPPQPEVRPGRRTYVPPVERKESKRGKKTLSFIGENSRLKRSSGQKKSVDPLARKSTQYGEGSAVEDIYNDDLAEKIDEELGLDDLEVPEQMAPRDVDELLVAWTNPVRDGNREHTTPAPPQR